MRILYVLEHYHPYIGGAEKLFQNVAEAMADKGHEVLVVTTRFDQDLPQKETINGVMVHRVTCFNRFFFTIVAFFHLLRLKEDFDVVHATTYNAAFPAWLYSKTHKCKSILTFHEVWGKLWFELPFLNLVERWGYYLYERLVLKLRFDLYIAVSEYTASSLKAHGIPDEKVITIYNGLEYPPHTLWSANESDTFRITYFGRLGVSKGLDLLIPAFHNIATDNPQVELCLVIPRQPRRILDKVLELIKKGPGSEKVRLYHALPRNELNDLILSSDAVAIPSYSEGFCFVAAESCALGVPIIHSGQGALAEVVSGKNVTMKEMSVDSLTDCIKLGILGHWNMIESRQFMLERSIREYLQLYENLKGV